MQETTPGIDNVKSINPHVYFLLWQAPFVYKYCQSGGNAQDTRQTEYYPLT